MKEIKCPNCSEVFQVDESGYAEILLQVKNKEFIEEVSRAEKSLEEKKKIEVDKIKAELELQSKDLNAKIRELESDLKLFEKSKETDIIKALNEKEKLIVELENRIIANNRERELELKTQESEFRSKLKEKEDELNYYKDLKARQSTKLVGENLEKHCEIEFNKLRAVAFKNAYFEKDNDAKDGTKGDYIYREFSEDGIEIISIMFEMKNETDSSSKKHRNEEFFKKLDKDRRDKNCEYAVLVSMLEKDNELYNTGIVDVSYKYEKMYVIRPQFFIPMITLLRNASLNSLKYKRELVEARNREVDITNFESELNDFKNKFTKNYEAASKKFRDAIENIDKTIKNLEKIKENLLSSEKSLGKANSVIDKITVSRLTKNNPTMKEKFKELENK